MKNATRGSMILALIRDEMNMVQCLSLDEMDEYIESLLVKIISGLSDDEIEKKYNDLMESELSI
jgi:hypothetical protein